MKNTIKDCDGNMKKVDSRPFFGYWVYYFLPFSWSRKYQPFLNQKTKQYQPKPIWKWCVFRKDTFWWALRIVTGINGLSTRFTLMLTGLTRQKWPTPNFSCVWMKVFAKILTRLNISKIQLTTTVRLFMFPGLKHRYFANGQGKGCLLNLRGKKQPGGMMGRYIPGETKNQIPSFWISTTPRTAPQKSEDFLKVWALMGHWIWRAMFGSEHQTGMILIIIKIHPREIPRDL